MGVPEDKVLIAEDGDIVIFNAIGGERVGRVESGKQVVDGTCVADHEDIVLHERRRLMSDGILIAVARLDRENRRLGSPIQLKSYGLFYEEEAEDALEAARLYAEAELVDLPPEMLDDKNALSDQLRAALKRNIKKNLSRFPVIIAMIVE
jgi:ribonuclease J